MRKVLSFVLVLSLVLGSFSMAFAATPTGTLSDTVGTDCEEAVRVLTSLGVVTGYADGTYAPEKIVTRAEATLIVIKALGLENSVGTQKSSYPDMSGYGWAEGYIAFATQLGIVNGYPDGTFKAGQTVSYNEMATMFVRALGYTDVSLQGTWPAKYVNQAAAVGIMDDVKSGGAAGANRGDVAIMANNALTAYIGSVDKDNNWGATIKSGSVSNDNAVYDTMISRLGGYFWKAVVQDNTGATINIKPYVGKFCAYYTDEADGKGDIIAIADVVSEEIAGGYADDAASVTGSGVIFEGNDDVDYKMGSNVEEYSYSFGNWDVDDMTYYFYNGEDDQDGDVTTSSATEIEVALSGKNIKTLYSVSAWDVSNNLKVEAGDLEDIADGELLGEDFDLDKNDEIIADSYELIGVTSLDNIKADNVVYVYVNDEGDNVIRRVAVGTEVVEGDIQKVTSGDDWKIDGKEYSFAGVAEAGFEDAEAGDTVKVWLDAYGDIYDVDVISGSAKDYAVVREAGDFDRIKLFLATDSSKVFDTDLDGELDAADAGDLIGYGLDKDGAIDSVYTDGFYTAAATAELVSNKVLDDGTSTYAIANDVVVFTLDGTSYGVSKIADVDKGSDSIGNVVSFLIRDDKIVAMIVDEDIASGSSTDSYAVISDVESAKNPVGDKALELSGYIDGKKMSDAFTSGSNTASAVSDTVVMLYKMKYNDDNMISKLDAILVDNNGVASEGKVSNGYITVDGVKEALADNAVVYEVEFDGTDIDKYSMYSGTIADGYNVWMFDTDSDEAGYEVVVIQKI